MLKIGNLCKEDAMKYFHPIYNEFYCNDKGEVFSIKRFATNSGIQSLKNKELDMYGFWRLKVHNLKDGYLGINCNGKQYRKNRFCYECYHNTILPDDTKLVVDHINHIRTDDSISNLRLISQKENIDNEYRNIIVSEAIKKNRHGKNGDGSLEEYLSTPHTLSHFKRDIKKRGYDFNDFIYVVFEKMPYRATKYMFSRRGN